MLANNHSFRIRAVLSSFRRHVSLALCAGAIIACSSGSTAGGTGGGGNAGPASCQQLCQHLSSTVCTSGATVESAADCVTECDVWSSPAPSACQTQLNEFNSCCASKDLSFKCPTDTKISAGDCNDTDTCKTQSDALEACCTNAGTTCHT